MPLRQRREFYIQMVGKTHLAVGLATGIGACIAGNLPPLTGVMVIAECGLGSLLPDIDQRNSIISKKVKPVGAVVSAVAGHRTIFHDPLLYLVLGLAAWKTIPAYMSHVISLLIGVVTHLFLDALNPTGIPILGFRLHLCNIHTGSSKDLFLGTMFRFIARFGLIFWAFRYLYQVFTGRMAL